MIEMPCTRAPCDLNETEPTYGWIAPAQYQAVEHGRLNSAVEA